MALRQLFYSLSTRRVLSTSSKPPVNIKKVKVNRSESRSTASEQVESKKSKYVLGGAFLAIPLITFGLGVWQVQRRKQKIALIDYLQERTRSQPLELPTDPKELANLTSEHEFRPFRVRGHFLHSREVLLTIRHDQLGRNTLPGAWVITPFVVSGRPDLVILVNRGYVPYTNYSPTTRMAGQIEGETEIVGLIRSDEPGGMFTPINKPPHEWHYRNVKEMSEALHTAPIYLDLVDSCTVKDGPLAGQTAINLRNEHMSYIITWFSLSALTSYMWWSRFGRFFF